MSKKLCSIEGCQTLARTKGGECKKHGGGPRCVEERCKTAAVDGSDRCKRHGGGPRCVEEGCKTAAEPPADKCKRHGGGHRCVIEGCKSSAKLPTNKCKKHGGGARCVVEGCTKSASQPSDKCVAHGGGARCPNCIDWIDSRSGKSKYDGYCATCFKEKFPNDDRSKVKHEHRKEIRVRNAINENFEGFIHDSTLYTNACDCTHRRRIDHRKLIGNTILAIETDEFAHSKYDERDEEIRYDDLYMIHSGKWIFIRFNPDGKGVDMSDKLDKLVQTIQDCIDRIENEENTELLEIIKLYY